MDDNTAIESQTKETNFFMCRAARRSGVTHKYADGGIVAKLDHREVCVDALRILESLNCMPGDGIEAMTACREMA
jgi:hypothetical protein